MTVHTLDVVLRSKSQRMSRGRLLIHAFDSSDRVRHGLPGIVAVSLAAGSSALLPGVDPVAPAILGVCGVFLLLGLLARPPALTGGGGPCPRCFGRVEVEPQPLRFPVAATCSNCGRSVEIQPFVPQPVASDDALPIPARAEPGYPGSLAPGPAAAPLTADRAGR